MPDVDIPKIDKEKLKKTFDTSHFDVNAFIRGAQLTLVGAGRALQNPDIFTSEHYKQAAIAVASGIGIRLLIAIPIIGVKVLLWAISFVFKLDAVTWDDTIVNGLNFIEDHVLQIPLFLMALMRYATPTLDNLFMSSLAWVDRTYVQKHKTESPSTLRSMYYPNLRTYPVRDGSTGSTSVAESLTLYLYRSARRAGISLAIFALSYVPYVGPLVLPAASFYTFRSAAGTGPAALLFGAGAIGLVPRKYLIVFLQGYFSSRGLVRQLLEPYFARVHMTSQQRRAWFRSREGILFGFGVGFYILLRIPLVGVLVYGIAEASAAYLITKITDPPPPVKEKDNWVEAQTKWRNKHEFLSLSLGELDKIHAVATGHGHGEPPAYEEVDPVTRGRQM